MKGCEDDCGLGLSDLQGEAVRDEIVQPVQGTADFSSCGSAPGGEVKKMESDSFCDAKRRQKAVLTKYKHGKFHVKVRKPLYSEVCQTWEWVAQGGGDGGLSPWRYSKPIWMYLRASCFEQGCWITDMQRSLPTQQSILFHVGLCQCSVC